jgi:hypothetical protein
MTLTEKLRLEVYIREQHQKHGDDFYTELAKILAKLNNEEMAINPRTRLVLHKAA